MSRKLPKQKAYKELGGEEKEETKEEKKEISTPDPPGHFPWWNPKEMRAEGRNAALGLVAQEGFDIESLSTFDSRRVSPTRGQVISTGAAALVSEARHRYITEESRPGAFRVAGLGYEEGFEEDDRTVNEEQATTAT
jgi:hypothetical protein